MIVLYCKTVGYAVVQKTPDEPNSNNVFIITLDGLRWQEVYNGADSALLNDKAVTTSSQTSLKNLYWDPNKEKRREKLMPFFWKVIAKKGQLLGNRLYGNYVNVSNIYALSYPGYNEIFTGKPDFTIFSNKRQINNNVTLLEYLNQNPAFSGKVVSFSSWNMFSYIFNKQRSNLYIDCSNKVFKVASDSCSLQYLPLKRMPVDKAIRNDFFTYQAAKDYLSKNHPRVVHIGLSGTDTYAHKKKYDKYLYQANLADKIIGYLWQLVQRSPFYKNNTTFIITTDHGRGATKETWNKHGFFVKGSSQTWLALLGNGIKNLGELHAEGQVYQDQIAGTIGYFLNMKSYSNHTLPITYFTALNNRQLLSAQNY